MMKRLLRPIPVMLNQSQQGLFSNIYARLGASHKSLSQRYQPTQLFSGSQSQFHISCQVSKEPFQGWSSMRQASKKLRSLHSFQQRQFSYSSQSESEDELESNLELILEEIEEASCERFPDLCIKKYLKIYEKYLKVAGKKLSVLHLKLVMSLLTRIRFEMSFQEAEGVEIYKFDLKEQENFYEIEVIVYGFLTEKDVTESLELILVRGTLEALGFILKRQFQYFRLVPTELAYIYDLPNESGEKILFSIPKEVNSISYLFALEPESQRDRVTRHISFLLEDPDENDIRLKDASYLLESIKYLKIHNPKIVQKLLKIIMDEAEIYKGISEVPFRGDISGIVRTIQSLIYIDKKKYLDQAFELYEIILKVKDQLLLTEIKELLYHQFTVNNSAIPAMLLDFQDDILRHLKRYDEWTDLNLLIIINAFSLALDYMDIKKVEKKGLSDEDIKTVKTLKAFAQKISKHLKNRYTHIKSTCSQFIPGIQTLSAFIQLGDIDDSYLIDEIGKDISENLQMFKMKDLIKIFEAELMYGSFENIEDLKVELRRRDALSDLPVKDRIELRNLSRLYKS